MCLGKVVIDLSFVMVKSLLNIDWENFAIIKIVKKGAYEEID